MTFRLLGAAVLLSGLCACGSNAGSPDTGDPNNPPIEDYDGGTSKRDGGGSSSGIVVSCDPVPAAVPVNSQVRINCVIDSSGKSIGPPELSATPADGVELANGTQYGQVLFSLSTGKVGYTHPNNFQDTAITVTVRVRNTAKPTEFGVGTVTVTVLGNYWIGDSNSPSGKGIFVYASDGTYLSDIVGPLGIQGVSDLRMLPSGDIVVSSQTTKVIKVFNRQGVQQPPAKFEDLDRWNGNAKIWDESVGLSGAGPRQMALSSTGELWVTGAQENKVWGLAVFNPGTGALVKFVPTTEVNNSYQFTSIARRSDGKMVVGANSRRTLCLYDEKDYSPTGCVLVDNNGWSSYSSLLALPDARILCGVKGNSTNGDPLYLLNPTMGVAQTGESKVYYPEMTALAVHGAEFLALGAYGNTVGDIQVKRFDSKTLKELIPSWKIGPQGYYMHSAAGLVRLAPPGN